MSKNNFLNHYNQFMVKYDNLKNIQHHILSFNTAEVHTIVSIGKNPDISLNQLAKVRKISKSAASQMTSKLVSKGIITKSRLENNAKRSALSLTNEGLKVFYEHMNQQTYLENELENVINEFSTEELTKITLLMSKIEGVWDNLPWNPANTKG